MVLVLAALLTIAPWTVRNARELHAFVPVSTQFGSALAGTYNDAAGADTQNPAAWQGIRHVPDYAHLFNRVGQTPEPVLERELRAASMRYIRENPTYVAKVGWWNTRRMLDLAGLRRSRATAATITINHFWADRGILCFWLLATLALAGAFAALARRTPWYVWAMPVLSFLSVVFLVVETPRYRTPVEPFLVLLATAPLVTAARWVLAQSSIGPSSLRTRTSAPGDPGEVTVLSGRRRASSRRRAGPVGRTTLLARRKRRSRTCPPPPARTPSLPSRARPPRVAFRKRYSSAAAAPAPGSCAAALRRSVAPPWFASALASQRCADVSSKGVKGANTRVGPSRVGWEDRR